MEVANIHTVVDRSGLRTAGARPTLDVSYTVSLLLLPGDPDESEQQERPDGRERCDGTITRVDPGEAHGSGENEGRDPGVPNPLRTCPGRQ